MASVTKNDGKYAMADDAELTGPADEHDDAPEVSRGGPPAKLPPAPPSSRPSGEGFFTIHKKGQGYWTRIGTVAGASLLAILTAQFLYSRGRTWFTLPNGAPSMKLVLGMVAAFLAVFAIIVFRIINRPTVVDFLIATDSEM